MQKFKTLLFQKKELVEKELKKMMISFSSSPPVLREAVAYSLLASAKRIRPVLCLMTAELFGPVSPAVLRCSTALELLHTYTLIHDDLPCMDDDDLRRGRPTLHRVYPEGIALLAGDALLTHAFLILAENAPDAEKGVRVIADFAQLTGGAGTIGGQVLDLISEDQDLSLNQLQQIHLCKTGKLIMASVRIGCILGGGDEDDLKALTQYGKNIGLAFQIADDLLDETGDIVQMGKRTRKDAGRKKATYPRLLGLEKSRGILEKTLHSAVGNLKCFSEEKAFSLRQMAFYIGNREK
ncbi:MAG: polyprenyl synthetase family protein [Candidatus Aureabacteria bacterium]|nr:polyprenyl synthetase family protein [Candidatus Auribacterota bacterium]